MSFWGKVFGTDAAVQKTIDTVAAGLDKLVYTSEEKADAAAKDRTEARSMLVGWMQATTGQNLARRVLAFAITFTWLFQYLIAQFASSLAIFWTTKAADLTALAKLQFDGASSMVFAVTIILAFYFAAPNMSEIISAILQRKNNSTTPTPEK